MTFNIFIELMHQFVQYNQIKGDNKISTCSGWKFLSKLKTAQKGPCVRWSDATQGSLFTVQLSKVAVSRGSISRIWRFLSYLTKVLRTSSSTCMVCVVCAICIRLYILVQFSHLGAFSILPLLQFVTFQMTLLKKLHRFLCKFQWHEHNLLPMPTYISVKTGVAFLLLALGGA